MIEAWFSSSEITASSASQQRLEQSAVGVEAGGIKNRVFGAQKLGEFSLQFLVRRLRAADEADARQPVTPLFEGLVCCRHDVGMIGQPQIIVRAHIEHAAPCPPRLHGPAAAR